MTYVTIARCAEHGLHGEREECFICSKPVEQVPFILASEYDAVLDMLRLLAEEAYDPVRSVRKELGDTPAEWLQEIIDGATARDLLNVEPMAARDA